MQDPEGVAQYRHRPPTLGSNLCCCYATSDTEPWRALGRQEWNASTFVAPVPHRCSALTRQAYLLASAGNERPVLQRSLIQPAPGISLLSPSNTINLS